MPHVNEVDEIDRIFFPFHREKREQVQKSGRRFVHYTSAEVAFSILRNRQVWMRKSSLMNDFREIDHGQTCLSAAWKGGEGEFPRALDRHFPGLAAEVATKLDA